jgi:hypothetical protein
MCPAMQPTGTMTTCTTNGLECTYGTADCTCHAFGAGGAWECVTPPPACPTSTPTAGMMCTAGTGGDAGCVYGTTTCHCLGAGAAGMDEWFCD